ncbi:MAG: glycosyltransferase family 2 protein [Solirubrobacteraceae bacterium]
MAEVVDCSVLVPVYNEERHIRASIAAMQRQRVDGTVEFVFADGGSTDATREILTGLAERDPRIRVFDNPARTVSSGLNVALRNARGRWIVRMDAHTVYPDDYITSGVNRLLQGGTRWVSGPQSPRGHDRVSRAVALALSTSFGRGGSRKWGRSGEEELPEFELDSGIFCGVWEKTTLLEYGGWDERWARNSDSEMAARFLRNGERLVCLPAMAARYVPRDSLPGLWRQYLGYGEYRVRTARRHPRSLRRSHLLPALVVFNGVVAVVGPGRLRAAARAAAVAHLLVLLAVGVRSLPAAEEPQDAVLVPVALGTMHFAFGVGMLRAITRAGLPLAALTRAVGLGRLGDALDAPLDAVFAPSLSVQPRAATATADDLS